MKEVSTEISQVGLNLSVPKHLRVSFLWTEKLYSQINTTFEIKRSPANTNKYSVSEEMAASPLNKFNKSVSIASLLNR